MPEPFDWTTFLRDYNAELIASKQLAETLQYTDDADLQTAVEAGWLGYQGAGEAQLADAEERLQVSLPPSYRGFLQASNGWRVPSTFIPRLWPADELAWFRDTDWETIEAWSEGDPELGKELQSALRISDEELGGSAVYLLVPSRATEGGECEAWMFAHWIPGAQRYRSFRELLEEERRSFVQIEGKEAKRLQPGETFSQLPLKVATLRDQLREKAQKYRQIAQGDPIGGMATGPTADGLDEVAARVEKLLAETHDPALLLSSLRTLQHDTEAEHRAIHQQRTQGGSPQDLLRLVQGAGALSRGEGLRQAAGIIAHFLRDAEV